MRVLVLNTDYPGFLEAHYAAHAGLEQAGYEEQLRARYATCFGVADFYSYNLRELGHEAIDVHVNNERLQRAWADEHGVPVPEPEPVGALRAALGKVRQAAAATPLRRLKPLLSTPRSAVLASWLEDLLVARTEAFRPDVTLNQCMEATDAPLLDRLRPHAGLLVGQIASAIPEHVDFDRYDLLISSMPHFVERFRARGRPAELHRFGFDPRVLERLDAGEPGRYVSFVGSISPSHASRLRLLGYLAERVDLRVWGDGVERLPADSPIRGCHQGSAWGLEMYQALRNSAVTLNHHIDIAGEYANNMRLFEATGVGAMMVTERKRNLYELFEDGREVATYEDPEECCRVVEHHLGDEEASRAIAAAGQRRTLEAHNYRQRMKELVEIVSRFV